MSTGPTAFLVWQISDGSLPLTVPVTPQPTNATDLQRFWDEVALPALVSPDPALTDPNDLGMMTWTYQSGGRPVEIVRTARPAPTTEEDLDRFWDGVMKPAILASYAVLPPDNP